MHVKLDTGMGRWGVSELPTLDARGRRRDDASRHRRQRSRLRARADRAVPRGDGARLADLTRHVANSAAALRLPESRFDAARCGIALYGLSPFGTDAGGRRARAGARRGDASSRRRGCSARGESTGYGRRFVAERDTWIGIVPGRLRRRLPPRPDRHARCASRASCAPVVGTVSMDAFAVELDRELPPGTPVTLVGHGVPLESHARVAGTITYELACADRDRPDAARAGSSPAPERRRARARDRRREERLEPHRRPVPARHEDLATVVLDAVEDPLDDERRVDDEPAGERSVAARAAGSPASRRSPGSRSSTEIAAAAELDRERAREAELRVLRRRVRAVGDRARDRDDVDDAHEPGARPGRNARSVHTEPR